MARWILKAAIQGCLALLPENHVWNGLFQEHVTKTLKMDEGQFRHKIAGCRQHVENYRKFADDISEFSALEFGTGWYPVLPVALYLCGASRMWTFDIRPLLRADRAAETLRSFLRLAASGDLRKMLPWVRHERLDALQQLLEGRRRSSAERMLEELGIHVRVGDARQTGLETSSVDFIVSNVTLEYIPPTIMREIFAEFRRVASGRAVMSHFIDMADDFSAFDSSLTPFNYLKYPSSTWRWINNSLISQNRLRISDYRTIHQAAGFQILRERNRMGSSGDLDRIRVAPEFRRYSREDLLVVGSWLVSRPVGPARTPRVI